MRNAASKSINQEERRMKIISDEIGYSVQEDGKQIAYFNNLEHAQSWVRCIEVSRYSAEKLSKTCKAFLS